MNGQEAKKGFITFVVTLAIAAGIYFSAYYAVNALNAKAQTQEPQTSSAKSQKTTAEKNTESQETGGDSQPSVFANLVQNQESEAEVLGTNDLILADSPSVLGAGDPGESTPGATPVTGSSFMSFLLVIGGSLFALGFMFSEKARLSAIRAFEKKITSKF